MLKTIKSVSVALVFLGLLSPLSASAQSTEMEIYLAQAEEYRLNSVYTEHMANNAKLLKRTALLYLITNRGNGVTTADAYFAVPFFGSGSSNLLNRPAFKSEIDKVNQFWAQTLSQYSDREILLEGWTAPSGGDPNRINRLVWINPDTLTIRIGPPSSGNTGGSTTGGGTGTGSGNTTPSTISGVISSHVNNARQALSYINSTNSSVSLPTFFEPQTPPPTTSGTNTTTSGAFCGLTSDLRIGDNNANVLTLTTELVKEGLLSAPTSSFDTNVYTAVIAYQERYASAILSPVGLTRGSGFVGPSTRNFINSRITCSTSTGGTTSGTTTGGSNTTTAAGLQNQINDLQRLIDSLLAQLNGGSTGTTGSTNTGTIGQPITIPTTFSASQTITGPISFRYLKVDSKSRSWIAWREIEVYDLQGNKINPTSGQVSCEWCNNSYARNSITGGADKVYDGDISSTWNAGETAPSCNWNILNQTVSACIAANSSSSNMSRTGWIILDYGALKNVSKIRLLTENNPNPSRAEHVISVGTNSNPTNQIAAFGGMVPTNTWIEVVISQ